MSVTEARWPRNTATGSGDGLLLIVCSSLCSTWNWTDKIGFQVHLYWPVKSNFLISLAVTQLFVLDWSKLGLDRIHILASSFVLCSFNWINWNWLNHINSKHLTFKNYISQVQITNKQHIDIQNANSQLQNRYNQQELDFPPYYSLWEMNFESIHHLLVFEQKITFNSLSFSYPRKILWEK